MSKSRGSVLHWSVLALVLLFGAGARTVAQNAAAGGAKGDEEMSVRQAGRVRAPELEGGRGWLNTDKPLSLAGLRGKVVLLDFWTYGCINCIHIIPDLQRLEQKYAKQLVVIGVHSAKFDNEKDTENIRRVILRYGIEHPVINDADFRIWQAYTVRAWPTQVLIDPAGYVVGSVAGEGNYQVLDETIAETIDEFRKRGALDEQPLRLALERARVGDLPLAFPGKILADAMNDRLFISDSNHNRIVMTRLDGTLIDIVGTGARGARDGAFNQSSFHRPQGLALDGDALYVADTANHLIRRVDLKTRTVSTLAGTGEQLRDYGVRGGPARTTPLSSPWDLQRVGRTLFIAMAGPHQIWKLDLTRQQLAVFAGTGREARFDGPRDEAAFAQPSGLATDNRTLYVADSESNIIRAVELDDAGDATQTKTADGTNAATATAATPSTASSSSNTDEQVRTLAGGDLFDFGDVDGSGDDARLQHPLGLAYADGQLFIADTYNHKIKRLDPRTQKVETFAGTGKHGQTDGSAPTFYEPGGLSIAKGKLYIADTNNHAVRVLDLSTRQTTTLVIRGLEPPATGVPATDESSAELTNTAGPNAQELTPARQRLGAGGTGALLVDVALPAGYHLNPSAPHRFKATLENGAEHLSLGAGGASPNDSRSISKSARDLRLPLRLPLVSLSPGASDLRVQFTLYYCREDNTGTCRVKTLVWRIPVEVVADPDAPREIKAQAEVQ